MKFLEFVNIVKQQKYFLTYTILLFFTPLIFVTNTNELFEFPKMFFVYFISLLLAYFFANDLIGGKISYKKPHFLHILYFVTFLIATIFSSHLYTSVWGYYSRFNDGLISLIAFSIIYIVALSVFTKDQLSKLMDITVLTILPISIYGISQHFGVSGLSWGADTVERVFSTFGQPNWLAQYLVMLLPFCLYEGVFSVFDRKRANLWAVLFVLGFSTLWFTYSMSGLLGLTLALFIFVICFRRQLFSAKIYVKRITVLISICGFVAISRPGIFAEKLHDAVFDFLLNKIQAATVVYAQDEELTSYKISDPGFIRIGLWRGTWDLISSSKKVFVVGTGPETYPYTFQPFRPPSLNYSSEWNYVFNKPHNYYLEVLSEQGLIGLISYLLLMLYILKHISKPLVPGFVGFAITNIFGWPVVSTALLFWFYLVIAQKTGEPS